MGLILLFLVRFVTDLIIFVALLVISSVLSMEVIFWSLWRPISHFLVTLETNWSFCGYFGYFIFFADRGYVLVTLETDWSFFGCFGDQLVIFWLLWRLTIVILWLFW